MNKYFIIIIINLFSSLSATVTDDFVEYGKKSDLIVRLMYKAGNQFPQNIEFLNIKKNSDSLIISLNSILYKRLDVKNDLTVVNIEISEKENNTSISITEKNGMLRLIDVKTNEKLWLATDEFIKKVNNK